MENDHAEEPGALAEVKRVRAMAEPGQRGRRATELIEEYDAARIELARIRREALDELVRSGLSQNEAAERFGLTKGRISQIKKVGPPIERAFLGTAGLTVALPLKLDAEYKRHALASEDVEVWDRLKQLAEDNQLKATRELISPPGDIDLNRPDLLVVCGPKLSPHVAAVLATDPAIQFERTDEGRFYLRDLRTDARFDSPGDVTSRQADYAYLARLERPDRRGGVLILTGIHAVGSAGVVHYLERHLAEIYDQVKRRRFSAIFEAEYDSNRQITGCQLVTPLYEHEEVADA